MEISEFSISDVLNGLRRNKVKVVLCFVVILGAAVALSVLLPRQYSSEAQLLVRLGRENATLQQTATIGDEARVNISQKREFETNSVAAMLRSQPLAEKVVDTIGADVLLDDGESTAGAGGAASEASAAQDMVKRVMESVDVAKDWVRSYVPSGGPDIGPRDQAIKALKTGLRVEPILETNMVQISYQSKDPELSQKVVSCVVENYLEEHVRIHKANGAHEFLMEHVDRLNEDLRSAEDELVALRRETGLISPTEQRSDLVERYGALTSDLNAAEAVLAQSQAEVDELTSTLEKIKSGENSDLLLVGATSEEADGMRTQLYQLQLEAEESLRRYTEDHVKAKRLRGQIDAAKSLLATQEVMLEIQQRKPALAAQKAKVSTLQEQIQVVDDELHKLNENEMRLSQLQRTIEICDVTFRQVSEDAEQSKIENSLDLAKITNISVVQPATRNLYAVFPNTRLNLLVALFLAIFVSTGIAVLSESQRMANERIRVSRTAAVVHEETAIEPTKELASDAPVEDAVAPQSEADEEDAVSAKPR